MNNIPILFFDYNMLRDIWGDEFMKLLQLGSKDLRLIRDRKKVFDKLNDVYSKIKARNLYNFYLSLSYDGINNTKEKCSKSSYYRNLKHLKDLNIDISQKIDIDMIDNTIEFNPFEYKEVV